MRQYPDDRREGDVLRLPSVEVQERDDRLARTLQLYLLGAVLSTATWGFPARVAPSLVVMILLLLVVRRLVDVEKGPSFPRTSQPGAKAFEAIIVTVALSAPIVWRLLTVQTTEFPFLGDHDFLFRQAEQSFAFWSIWYMPVIALFIAACVFGRSDGIVAAAALGIALVAGAISSSAPEFAVRYPAGFQFILFPMQIVIRAAGGDPLDAARLLNAASVPVWLLLLRPVILGRRPERALLPAGAFLYFQKDVVYYVTSAYMEPWALVLVLVAVEHVVIFGSARGWRPLLLVGCASLFKEQAILLLPFIAAAAWPAGDRVRQRNHVVATLVSALPFVAYYGVRVGGHVRRGFEPLPISELVAPDRLEQWAVAAAAQLGPAIVWPLVAGVGLAVLAWRNHEGLRVAALSFLAAAVIQDLFFFSDRHSLEWTGYFRFRIMTLAALGGFFLWVGHRCRRTVLVALSIAIGLSHVPGLVELSRHARAAYEQNFFEHDDAPVYLAVGAAVRQAVSSGLVSNGETLRITSDLAIVRSEYEPWILPIAYHEIARSHPVVIEPELTCRCDGAIPMVVLWTYETPNVSPLLSRSLRQARGECEAELLRTCRRISKMRYREQVVAAVAR